MVALVGGNPRSGETTLTAELRRRGMRAFDANKVLGLAFWLNAHGVVAGDGSLARTP
jgi:hypothetical protein